MTTAPTNAQVTIYYRANKRTWWTMPLADMPASIAAFAEVAREAYRVSTEWCPPNRRHNAMVDARRWLEGQRPAKPAPAGREHCARCDGTGRLLAFSHVAGGACFGCEGRGHVRG
tara:strand:- start:36253 stop:36597 length:345 start_codon:yes stop_codon:yes gene_type:complete